MIPCMALENTIRHKGMPRSVTQIVCRRAICSMHCCVCFASPLHEVVVWYKERAALSRVRFLTSGRLATASERLTQRNDAPIDMVALLELPTEILERVADFLPLADLKMACLSHSRLRAATVKHSRLDLSHGADDTMHQLPQLFSGFPPSFWERLDAHDNDVFDISAKALSHVKSMHFEIEFFHTDSGDEPKHQRQLSRALGLLAWLPALSSVRILLSFHLDAGDATRDLSISEAVAAAAIRSITALPCLRIIDMDIYDIVGPSTLVFKPLLHRLASACIMAVPDQHRVSVHP